MGFNLNGSLAQGVSVRDLSTSIYLAGGVLLMKAKILPQQALYA
jgi:hypothetical protein